MEFVALIQSLYFLEYLIAVLELQETSINYLKLCTAFSFILHFDFIFHRTKGSIFNIKLVTLMLLTTHSNIKSIFYNNETKNC